MLWQWTLTPHGLYWWFSWHGLLCDCLLVAQARNSTLQASMWSPRGAGGRLGSLVALSLGAASSCCQASCSWPATQRAFWTLPPQTCWAIPAIHPGTTLCQALGWTLAHFSTPHAHNRCAKRVLSHFTEKRTKFLRVRHFAWSHTDR